MCSLQCSMAHDCHRPPKLWPRDKPRSPSNSQRRRQYFRPLRPTTTITKAQTHSLHLIQHCRLLNSRQTNRVHILPLIIPPQARDPILITSTGAYLPKACFASRPKSMGRVNSTSSHKAVFLPMRMLLRHQLLQGPIRRSSSPLKQQAVCCRHCLPPPYHSPRQAVLPMQSPPHPCFLRRSSSSLRQDQTLKNPRPRFHQVRMESLHKSGRRRQFSNHSTRFTRHLQQPSSLQVQHFLRRPLSQS